MTLTTLLALIGTALAPAASPGPAPTTYHVNQRHPAAADENDGTEGKPFATIAAAVRVLKAGDEVLIHGGVYREHVIVESNGTSEAPIVLRAAGSDRVVVTGADLLRDLRKADMGPGANAFRVAWPHRFIAYSPQFTHPGDDWHRMIGRAEQVFVQGYPLLQVLRREALSRGTFFVDPEAGQLTLWSRDNRDLAQARVEVEASVRPVISTVRGAHVHLKGLTFRYAANRAQQGAVQMEGDHGVVEDCTFERTNSIGASFRGVDCAAIRCVFQENGQMGFGASRAHNLRMTECVCRRNNLKGYDRGWEAGGNKIVLSRGVIIESSIFIENQGNGIWFDIGNEDSTVRRSYIADNDDAGIFYEISFGLHAHDNVIVRNGFGATGGAWGADGGISISSSPGCVIERNLLVANREGLQFREQIRTTPTISGKGDRKAVAVWNHDEVVRNNTIAGNRDLQVGGWFDVLDGRHWPSALREPESGADPATDIAAPYRAKGAGGVPEDLSLETLRMTLAENLYRAEPWQGLYRWGCPWRRHRTYSDLDRLRRELGLEQGSRIVEPAFIDPARGDFRLPAGHPALVRGCYPRGDVPGLRLGESK
ncbi:MAG: right-handed parallel beta-helix repeat-containing protein [Planctomycetes bacterium]|nr:right-handed parallel beta-helix repeat-containing protein [Planctomycetota bacterium]